MTESYIRNAVSQIQGRASNLSQQSQQQQRQDLTGRLVKDVCPPTCNQQAHRGRIFPNDDYGTSKPNAGAALYIIDNTTRLLTKEPNMVDVKSPVTVCGDIHGQYYDLMKLFEVGGAINDGTYLFLGDYVDRGDFGIECLLYLYALKMNYPTKFVLLRGNHECRHLTEYFTFKRECLHKYSERVYEACITSFCALPIAAWLTRGFSACMEGFHPIEPLPRTGSHGLLCDLSGLLPGTKFLHNQTRGCSFFFTYEAVCQFLDANNLLSVIRGHEAQDAGYTMHRKSPRKNFPSVITIFSAPNYLDVYHNRGAVLKYANKNITIRQYNSSSHPYWLPNFINAFTWSLPFVGTKITEMLLAVLSVCSAEELETESDSDEDGERTEGGPTAADIAARRQQIKNKIMAVGKMQRVFQLLREEAENATELIADGVQVPVTGPDKLGVQGNQIGRAIRTFADARRSDLLNERLPEFDPHRPTMFPVPSMRLGGSSHDLTMEHLIKRALEEEEDGGTVEAIADRIARARRLTGRPSALKRHETVL
ncbi:Metallo-dependent phosphatase-like protein [Cyathus striatus]|nr:Metallo-dependent phosphatase-like protein [Cyathus striatus]